MSEDGHRYTFGYRKGNPCSRCGSHDHWTMHCPEEEKEDDGQG